MHQSNPKFSSFIVRSPSSDDAVHDTTPDQGSSVVVAAREDSSSSSPEQIRSASTILVPSF